MSKTLLTILLLISSSIALKTKNKLKTKMEGYKKFLEDLGDNVSKCVYLLFIRISTDELDKEGKIFQVDESQKEMLEKIDEICKEQKNETKRDNKFNR